MATYTHKMHENPVYSNPEFWVTMYGCFWWKPPETCLRNFIFYTLEESCQMLPKLLKLKCFANFRSYYGSALPPLPLLGITCLSSWSIYYVLFIVIYCFGLHTHNRQYSFFQLYKQTFWLRIRLWASNQCEKISLYWHNFDCIASILIKVPKLLKSIIICMGYKPCTIRCRGSTV